MAIPGFMIDHSKNPYGITLDFIFHVWRIEIEIEPFKESYLKLWQQQIMSLSTSKVLSAAWIRGDNGNCRATNSWLKNIRTSACFQHPYLLQSWSFVSRTATGVEWKAHLENSSVGRLACEMREHCFAERENRPTSQLLYSDQMVDSKPSTLDNPAFSVPLLSEAFHDRGGASRILLAFYLLLLLVQFQANAVVPTC